MCIALSKDEILCKTRVRVFLVRFLHRDGCSSFCALLFIIIITILLDCFEYPLALFVLASFHLSHENASFFVQQPVLLEMMPLVPSFLP